MAAPPAMPVESSDNFSDNTWENGHGRGEEGRRTEKNV